jgi:radical SAM protein with 4Fe4S-binding SPASM domain
MALFGLGEVLVSLGQTGQAYDLWYEQAHKPPAERQPFDIAARIKVLRLFEAHGLRLRPPDFPPQIQVEVTNRCNLRCIMCTRNQMTRSTGSMSLETFRRVADEWSREPGAVLRLYFLGEPLLHRELERMVSYTVSVRDRNPAPGTVGIQTNGMLLTRERARSLLAAGLRSFSISLDGLEGDLERVRPGASYRTVERNICALVELGKELGLSDLTVNITKLCDDPEADEVKRFAAVWSPRVTGVYLAGISKVPGNAYLASDGTVRAIDKSPGRPAPVYCGEGQRILVHHDGTLAFCCSDVNGALNVGNVEHRSIRDAWNSVEMQTIRRRVRNAEYENLEPCRSCVAGGNM